MPVSWAITIPKAIRWEDYKLELAKAAAGEILNFRVPRFFKSAKPGDRIYVVHRGRVVGWMLCVGLVNWPDGFTCSTTGQRWPPGKYLQRSGVFEYVKEHIPMRSFQGVRRYNENEVTHSERDHDVRETGGRGHDLVR